MLLPNVDHISRRIREAYRKGMLTEEQITRLKTIGFVFQAKPKKQRPIRCLETGETYPNMKAIAERYGDRNSSSISAAVRSKGSYKGFHWYYADEPKPELNEFKKRQGRVVICVETGEMYSNMREASRETGIPYGSMTAAVQGRRKRAGGRRWRYATEEEIRRE